MSTQKFTKQHEKKCRRMASDISRALKKECDVQCVGGTNIFTSYLDSDVAISVTEANGNYIVLAAQRNVIVFDLIYRTGGWSKINIYSPKGTWERVIQNRISGQSDSNVIYRAAWFTDPD